ncbi:MAG: cytochrome c [Burkholderiaceae bacterium]
MRAPLLGKALSIGYLLVLSLLAADLARAQPGECPQPRFTGKAPDDYYSRTNSVVPSDAATKAAAALFLGSTRGGNCAVCHGKNGDGKGPLASQYDPPPRNFSCARTVAGVPDGQLFWIIRFGSPGAAMPPHPSLSDDQIWQLVLYLRSLVK